MSKHTNHPIVISIIVLLSSLLFPALFFLIMLYLPGHDHALGAFIDHLSSGTQQQVSAIIAIELGYLLWVMTSIFMLIFISFALRLPITLHDLKKFNTDSGSGPAPTSGV
ncbi:MAG: hypothetical protein GY847_09485 [Proteobacteria bacterium]|nr:hypothetical protein [Pseudomonadota bacterium]